MWSYSHEFRAYSTRPSVCRVSLHCFVTDLVTWRHRKWIFFVCSLISICRPPIAYVFFLSNGSDALGQQTKLFGKWLRRAVTWQLHIPIYIFKYSTPNTRILNQCFLTHGPRTFYMWSVQVYAERKIFTESHKFHFQQSFSDHIIFAYKMLSN
jgi:hypothetical protein